MRLLRAATRTLEEFASDAIPRYAILSHTWDTEEVTFDDIHNPDETVGTRKAGLYKIICACEQAIRDGLDYVWIDTCCIDKRSSSELTEAINSMYKWYTDSEICYAFLPDVCSNVELVDIPEDASPHELELFDGSGPAQARWFCRGWCLQELIAPRRVNFYGEGWFYLGSNFTLSRGLSRITNIDVAILSNPRTTERKRLLLQTSVARRMSWAADRKTSRREDLAYCLLGIFDVHMPMLYGEGDRAFIRLQEEIIKVSDDHSLFAWEAESYKGGLLAPNPFAFKRSADIVQWFNPIDSGPYSMTNKGLSISLPLLYSPQNIVQIRGILACAYRDEFTGPIGLTLQPANRKDIYYVPVLHNRLTVVDLKVVQTEHAAFRSKEQGEPSTYGVITSPIYISRDTPPQSLMGFHSMMLDTPQQHYPINFWVQNSVFLNGKKVVINEVEPPDSWHKDSGIISLQVGCGTTCAIRLTPSNLNAFGDDMNERTPQHIVVYFGIKIESNNDRVRPMEWVHPELQSNPMDLSTWLVTGDIIYCTDSSTLPLNHSSQLIASIKGSTILGNTVYIVKVESETSSMELTRF
ncbi:HET-domain-containing protein [Tothia fuscella]|uniref:HET-domain-containing protein n=1 Tax=Tothia fuscella TaxID=1048955 RepID=A0A9P4NRV6_9PEZI|nr:HET-domain-containing protein [Tothia fuscella]